MLTWSSWSKAPRLTEALDIKDILPAYLDPFLEPNELLTGVSFASGAAGYDPLTSKLAMAISLEKQVELFKEYLAKVTAIGGEEKAKRTVRCGCKEDWSIQVFGVPPIGCLPSQRTLAGGKARNCVESYNKAAQIFNSKLSPTLAKLTSEFEHGRAVYADIYDPILEIIDNPHSYCK
ncbi:hypothetical protein MKX01_003820 [Papaver californicum]|nr:hypothetical protein MKX01_003820 [Papaver californicum]